MNDFDFDFASHYPVIADLAKEGRKNFTVLDYIFASVCGTTNLSFEENSDQEHDCSNFNRIFNGFESVEKSYFVHEYANAGLQSIKNSFSDLCFSENDFDGLLSLNVGFPMKRNKFSKKIEQFDFGEMKCALIMRAIFDIHERWRKENEMLFFRLAFLNQRFRLLPLSLVGFDEIKAYFSLVEPIFNALGIFVSEDDLKDTYYRYHFSSLSPFVDGSKNSRNALKSFVADELLYSNEVEGQPDYAWSMVFDVLDASRTESVICAITAQANEALRSQIDNYDECFNSYFKLINQPFDI